MYSNVGSKPPLWPSFAGDADAVIAGSGCYWEKGGSGGVPPHRCTYDAHVCCPEGCESAGGLREREGASKRDKTRTIASRWHLSMYGVL